MDPFDRWMEKVDDALVEACGMENGDLPDACWADMYEDEIPPEEAAASYLDDNLGALA